MPAPLARTYCRITMGDGTVHDGVSLQVPPGRTTAVARKGRSVVVTRDGVTTVTKLGGEWSVTFDDGEVWTVRDSPKPCGCS